MKFYATNMNGMTGKIGQLLTQKMKYSGFSSITGRQYLSVKHSIDRLHPTKKNWY